MNTLSVSNSIKTNEPITTSAERLAKLIDSEIRHHHQPVQISFKGLRGIPSSFYNTLLHALKKYRGISALSDIAFDFDSELQRSVFERARQAFEKQQSSQ